MAKNSGYFKEFLKERKTVGALSPSSRFLMKNMVKHVDFSKAKVIAELGPGNGVFTKGILERMSPDAKLYNFELNEAFYNHIKENIVDDRMILLHESAENLKKVLQEHGHEKADYIISALPLMVLPKEMKTKVLETVLDSLSPEGHFVQFQYSLNARKLLKSKFSEVKIGYTLGNVPPAFVYKCTL